MVEYQNFRQTSHFFEFCLLVSRILRFGWNSSWFLYLLYVLFASFLRTKCSCRNDWGVVGFILFASFCSFFLSASVIIPWFFFVFFFVFLRVLLRFTTRLSSATDFSISLNCEILSSIELSLVFCTKRFKPVLNIKTRQCTYEFIFGFWLPKKFGLTNCMTC